MMAASVLGGRGLQSSGYDIYDQLKRHQHPARASEKCMRLTPGITRPAVSQTSIQVLRMKAALFRAPVA